MSEILGRGVSIEWYEAVAVVRGVADGLVALGSGGVPELHQVRLRPNGEIDLVGASTLDEPVRRLGQMLQALMTQTDSPVQLRLMITQATSPAPTFASIQEFSNGLAYFERPDRTGLLSRLFERAAAARPLSESTIGPTLDEVAPLPHDPSKPSPAAIVAKKAAKSPLFKMLAGLAVVALILVGGYRYARRHGMGPDRSEMNKMAGQASNTLGNAVVNGVSAVTEKLGLGRIVPADAPPSPPPSTPPAPGEPQAAKASGAPAPAKTVKSRAIAGAAFDLAPTTPGLPRTMHYEAVVTEHAVDTEAASDVYGPESADVVPPEAVEPPLPHQLPPGLSTERLTGLQLVIAVDGTVESVKLGNPPHSIKDAMFLSVAKAWQFKPALKDGVPVRYRKTIWIASQ